MVRMTMYTHVYTLCSYGVYACIRSHSHWFVWVWLSCRTTAQSNWFVWCIHMSTQSFTLIRMSLTELSYDSSVRLIRMSLTELSYDSSVRLIRMPLLYDRSVVRLLSPSETAQSHSVVLLQQYWNINVLFVNTFYHTEYS